MLSPTTPGPEPKAAPIAMLPKTPISVAPAAATGPSTTRGALAFMLDESTRGLCEMNGARAAGRG